MDKNTHKLCRALRVCAAYCRLPLLPVNLGSAWRTNRRNKVRRCTDWMLYNRNYLRNYISGFTYCNSIPDTDSLFRNKVLIVKCCPAYNRSGNKHRLKVCNRCKHTGTSDIDFNINNLCLFFFRRILVSYSPFREFWGASEFIPSIKIVYLYNSAVNIERQCITYFTDTFYFILCIFKVFARCIKRYRIETQTFKIIKWSLVWWCIKIAVNLLYIENENIKIAFCSNTRILLSQRTRSGISRVFKRFFIVEFLFFYKL